MWQLAISLVRLCLFAVLAGCYVDLSKLRAPPHKDAATSPDTVFPNGDSGGTVDAKGGLDEPRSADVPAIGQDVQPGEGIDDAPYLGGDAWTDALASGGRGGAG